MLELNAISFLGASTHLARLHQILFNLVDREAMLIPDSVIAVTSTVKNFRSEAEKLGARLAVVAADRLLTSLDQVPCQVTVDHAVRCLNDIESRFADYLDEISLFTLSAEESALLANADSLVQLEGFSAAFPNAAFEVEESAKCVALGRYTAAVFHAMRMLEIGIRALAKRIGLDDPTEPSEKNWGAILNAIKNKLDGTWPPRTRLQGSEGAQFANLYASLDAVKNPWRNATMHVETIYAPHEALHIIRCSAFFMRLVHEVSNEKGELPVDPVIPRLIDYSEQ